MEEPNWLVWARELQAIAQTGLNFSADPYDLERYQRLRAIAVEMLAAGSGAPIERISALFDQDLGYPTPKVDVRGAVFRRRRVRREVELALPQFLGGQHDGVLLESLGEFLLILVTAAGIILLPIEQGVGLGIALSLLHGIWTTTRARVRPLERVPGTSIWFDGMYCPSNAT